MKMKTKIKVEYFQEDTKYSATTEEKEKLPETGKNLAYKVWYFLDTLSLSHEIIEHNVSYSKLKEEDGNIIVSAIVTAKISVE